MINETEVEDCPEDDELSSFILEPKKKFGTVDEFNKNFGSYPYFRR